MTEVTLQDLLDAGFIEEIKTHWNGSHKTGYHILPGWLPVPKIESNLMYTPMATIGALQWYIRSEQDLEKFIHVAVPKFCESNQSQTK